MEISLIILNLIILLNPLSGFCAPHSDSEENTIEPESENFQIMDVVDKIVGPAKYYPHRRIFGGQLAREKQFPYQALLIMESTNNPDEFAVCGGTLISNKAILTAAHCFENFNSGLVLIGIINILHGDSPIKVTRDNIKIFDGFAVNDSDISGDLAMIILPEAVEFNDFVNKVDLPDPDVEYTKELGIVSGFGRTVPEGAVSLNLQYARFNIQNCKKFEWIWVIDNRDYDSYLCVATTRGRSACSGDSGGPLVIPGDDRMILVGVTSFTSTEDCVTGGYNVFTRVSKYLDWIKENME